MKNEEKKSGEETVKKNSNSTTNLLLIIIIFLIILLGICIFFLVKQDKNIQSPNNNNNIQQTDNNKPTNTLNTIELTDPLVEQSQRLIPNTLCGGLLLELPNSEKNISEFSDFEKLDMILSIKSKEIIGTASTEVAYTFSEEELKKYFDDLSFLNSFKPAIDTGTKAGGEAIHDGAKVIKNPISYPLYMKFENGNISATAYGTGCIGPTNNGNYLKIKAAKKSNDELVIDYYQYYLKLDDFDPDLGKAYYFIFKNKEDTTSIDRVSDYENYNFDDSKFNVYSFTFDIKNGNLKLKSIKHIN